MKTFSIGEAIAEPFRQAGRRPMTVIGWGLVLLAPTVIAFAAMVPLLADMAASGAFDRGPDADVSPFDDNFAAMMQFQIWSQLANLLQLLAVLLVTTAMIRAVFAGRRSDRTGFLRVGMHELYVAVIGVTIFFGMITAMVATALLAVAIGMAFSGIPDPWRVLIYVGVGVAYAVGFLALWGRLALLAPASLRYETFAFVEGWKLGRGQTRRLLGVLLLQFLIFIAIGIAFALLLMLVVALVGGGVAAATDPDAVLTWLETLPDRPALLIGVGIVLLIPLAWIHGFSQLLATAPFARAVLELEPRPDDAISADTTPIAH